MNQLQRPVRDLFFGRDDAEHDFADGLLKRGFQHTLAYEAALDGRKSLIIGRKGSGKSAICAQLAHGGVYPGPTAEIVPDNAAGDEIRRFDLQGLTSDTAKSLIWRYLFALEAARHVVDHSAARHGRSLRRPAPVRALRDFLRTNGEEANARLPDRLRRGASRLQSATLSVKMFGVEASMQTGEGMTESGSEGARAMRQLDALESGVREALDALDCAAAGHPPLLVLVDQLELVWQADPDSHALVTGLLVAAKHIARTYGKGVRCVLFIRSDIYDTLNFADGDKFRSDEIHITWTPGALQDLALARASLSLGRDLTHSQLWGDIFPSAVGGEPTADYLVHRSLPRPRDAIQFLTRCRDVAWERGHSTVRGSDILAATKRFSQWKLEDLAREYNVGFPFLREVFALFEHGEHRISRDTFEERFAAIHANLHETYSAYTDHLNAQAVVEALFAIGFLGVRRGEGVAYAGSTALPVQPYEDELHVHPCFRSALHCEEIATPHRVGGSPALPTHTSRQAHTSFLRSITVTDAGFTVNREVRLLGEVELAAQRLLRHLGRSGLPAHIREETTRELTEGLAQARRPARGDESVDTRVRTTIAILEILADRLSANGYGREPVTLRLADEARSLERVLGGLAGGGGSDSSG
ncbi:P-loop ATPase, Sll1717 family [Streptomyces sp. NPDC055189]